MVNAPIETPNHLQTRVKTLPFGHERHKPVYPRSQRHSILIRPFSTAHLPIHHGPLVCRGTPLGKHSIAVLPSNPLSITLISCLLISIQKFFVWNTLFATQSGGNCSLDWLTCQRAIVHWGQNLRYYIACVYWSAAPTVGIATYLTLNIY